MNEQRIKVDSRNIEIVLASGERLQAEIFLQLHGLHLTGPQRVGEVLNGEESFLPIRIDQGVRLVNLDQVIAVYVAASDEFDPLLELGAEHEVYVTSMVGDSLKARIFVNLPHGRNRAKDFLNQPKRFLLFLQEKTVVYLAKKSILLVED
ncbi:MAG: hypothetical protein L3J63_06990 [Geopsychrobacter sp.]|nr:hypothetical protein [Geopsychrobacter sp.]